MTKIIIADVGKFICPGCKQSVVPSVQKTKVCKFGCNPGVIQKNCPSCGNKLSHPIFAACCFIATAAYGSELDTRVRILCEFRDKYLSKNVLGRIFIKFYYSISPQIAKFISRFDFLKAIVRLCLTPIVHIVEKKLHKTHA